MAGEWQRVTLTTGAWVLMAAGSALAQDWPQWLGPTRNAQAPAFVAPAMWPTQLKSDWTMEAGNGVSTPALVGERLYVFARTGAEEVLRCLGTDGKEIWSKGYAVGPADGAAGGFPGPRSSPAVAQGKVVTLSVRGTVSCFNAETGDVLWRKEEFNGKFPRFFTSSSPIIVNDIVVAQVGGEQAGAVVAFDLNTGAEKWKWVEDGTAYSSPAVLQMEGTPVLIAETAGKIVGFDVSDGKKLWEAAYPVTGRGYNASTPIVAGDLLIYAGSNRGVKAVRLKKQGTAVEAQEVWSNTENSVIYNTPVVANGLVVGITNNDLIFAIDLATGKTSWTHQMKERPRLKGYGTLVAAGGTLFAMNPAAQLTVFEANPAEYKELASFKVSDKETYAVPVAVGKRIYIKDQEKLTAWSVE